MTGTTNTTKRTHDAKANSDQRRRGDCRQAGSWQQVDRRIQQALLGTIGRPFA